jgi:uncharacterized protein (TIRG00374 family)
MNLPSDTEKKNEKKKKVFLFLRLAVVAAGIIWAIVWISGGQRWENLKSIFIRMNLGVFAAALFIFVIGQGIIGLRWWILLKTQSIFIGFWAAVRLHFLGLFYNNFMPGAVGGDLIRAWYVTKHTHRRFEAALSVFVDRIVGLLSTLCIAAFFYTVFMADEANKISFTGKGGFLKSISEHKNAVFGVVIVVVSVFCVIASQQKGRAKLKQSGLVIWAHSLKFIHKLRNAIVLYWKSPLAILSVFGLTVLMQMMVITGFLFLGRNLGIGASAKYYYVFFTLTWVLGAVPVSVGGAVVVEGLLAYMFIQFAGVEAEAALALALCQRIVWMLTSLPGAAIHLFGAHLPKDFSVDYDASIT